MNQLLLLIIFPALAGILCLLLRKKNYAIAGIATVIVALVNAVIAVSLFASGKEQTLSLPWAQFGMEFSLLYYHFSGFIIMAAAGFTLLVALYALPFMKERGRLNQFYAYMLVSTAMTNGAVLADNLIAMLFFWEGLLLTLFGMIMTGGNKSYKTAIKALVLVGVSDICLMLGIAMIYYYTGTLTIGKIHLELAGGPAIAFLLLMTGAIAKAGSMPFHSWIPDAASDAPLPFMAFMPAALEKLLGIYFLARLTLDLFALNPGSWASTALMVIGSITILGAVMMALIQKDYKRLLSYHAISQVGYMILGIGTAVPAGIVGGLFHMINHALYKSCLFLTAGSVERQAGSTDLAKLGGIGKNMPVTFTCFIVAAAAISGVPPLNGFFSKELVYDGALERGWPFYAAAALGSFLTAASFLKLGHAAFMGPRANSNTGVKEAPLLMLVPLIIIAGLCILFGVYNPFPLHSFIEPILGPVRLAGKTHAGLPHNMLIVGITVAVIAIAFIHHRIGVARSGSGLGAVDHIHYAPGLKQLYTAAEKRFFDPYEIGMKLVGILASIGSAIDRAINWIYDSFSPGSIKRLGQVLAWAHNGNYALYIVWSIAGAFLIFAWLMM